MTPNEMANAIDEAFENFVKDFLNRTLAGEFIIPSGITLIPDYAFQNSKSITAISFPATLTRIGIQAFKGCTSLTSLFIPKSLYHINRNAFDECSGLVEVVFEGTVSIIDASVFNRCENLEIIKVPWEEGKIKNAPWGATNATIIYNYIPQEEV